MNQYGRCCVCQQITSEDHIHPGHELSIYALDGSLKSKSERIKVYYRQDELFEKLNSDPKIR
jgi:hypothetical protein